MAQREQLLSQARVSEESEPILKEQCIYIRQQCEKVFSLAKSRWIAQEANQIACMPFDPKTTWKKVLSLNQDLRYTIPK